MTSWIFFTTHARVLLIIAGEPNIRLRDIATTLGVTERRAHAIVADLADGGFVTRHRIGRRNHYEIQPQRQINDDIIDLKIGDLLNFIESNSAASVSVEGRPLKEHCA